MKEHYPETLRAENNTASGYLHNLRNAGIRRHLQKKRIKSRKREHDFLSDLVFRRCQIKHDPETLNLFNSHQRPKHDEQVTLFNGSPELHTSVQSLEAKTSHPQSASPQTSLLKSWGRSSWSTHRDESSALSNLLHPHPNLMAHQHWSTWRFALSVILSFWIWRWRTVHELWMWNQSWIQIWHQLWCHICFCRWSLRKASWVKLVYSCLGTVSRG